VETPAAMRVALLDFDTSGNLTTGRITSICGFITLEGQGTVACFNHFHRQKFSNVNTTLEARLEKLGNKRFFRKTPKNIFGHKTLFLLFPNRCSKKSAKLLKGFSSSVFPMYDEKQHDMAGDRQQGSLTEGKCSVQLTSLC
jgi:hypothetical protein